MPIDFAESRRSSVGIEWELACVDRLTGDLAPAAPEILKHLDRNAQTHPHVTQELLTNTVEIVSGAHLRVADAVTDLAREADDAVAVCDELGLDLIGAGMHPFATWHHQEITPGSSRYRRMVDRTQWWGRQLLIWGVHNHIGVGRSERVIPILQTLLRFYPHFQALSASSPFLAGVDTAYASNRTLVYQQMPTAGLPPDVLDWSDYERVAGDLQRVGVIHDHTELRWDVRPAPRWGTIELRFCDSMSTLREIGAVTALAQCLVEESQRTIDAGRVPPRLQPWYVRENKWRGARYGLDTDVIVTRGGDERPLVDDLRDLVDRLAPIAEDLGCSTELGDVETIIRRGPGYRRQREVAARHGGDTRAVVAALAAEFRAGRPAPVGSAATC